MGGWLYLAVAIILEVCGTTAINSKSSRNISQDDTVIAPNDQWPCRVPKVAMQIAEFDLRTIRGPIWVMAAGNRFTEEF